MKYKDYATIALWLFKNAKWQDLMDEDKVRKILKEGKDDPEIEKNLVSIGIDTFTKGFAEKAIRETVNKAYSLVAADARENAERETYIQNSTDREKMKKEREEKIQFRIKNGESVTPWDLENMDSVQLYKMKYNIASRKGEVADFRF